MGTKLYILLVSQRNEDLSLDRGLTSLNRLCNCGAIRVEGGTRWTIVEWLGGEGFEGGATDETRSFVSALRQTLRGRHPWPRRDTTDR